jgi:uncharacterized membrane protein
MRVLYAGDSPLGGPANYLLGILRSLRAKVVHLPPSKVLRPLHLKRKYDAIVLSDFPRSQTPLASQRAIRDQVGKGTGLLMVGGWGSFNGPFGKWRGSLIEKLLPISCLSRDDRVNFPGGAWLVERRSHPMFRSLTFKDPPVICGLNQFRPKRNGQVILTARRIVPPSFFSLRKAGGGLRWGEEYPLLVIDSNPKRRIAALATDLAPHWCGGLVDWGRTSVRLRVRGGIWVEVGDRYVRLVSSLLKWLCYNSSRGGKKR